MGSCGTGKNRIHFSSESPIHFFFLRYCAPSGDQPYDGTGLAVAMADDQATRLKAVDRKSTRLNSSHLGISYAVFCLKKKKENSMHVNAQQLTPLYGTTACHRHDT